MSVINHSISRRIACSIVIFLGLLVWAVPPQARAEGGGQARIGYLYLDEEGNRGVSRESFNIYEGPILSLENFHYLSANGLNATANLRNISLNNRDLQAALSKPGQFGLALHNSQYRRIYSFEGDKYTRRRSTGGQGHYIFRKHFKLFGGFSRVDRHGESQYIAPAYGDVVPLSSDYSLTSFNIGAQALFRKGNLRLKYHRSDFNDNQSSNGDRESGHFDVDAFVPFPGYEKLQLSGGYRHRRELHEASSIKLKTDQGWLGLRLFVAQETTIEYRFVASRSEHSLWPVEIDNYINTLDLGRNWARRGGIRVGFENRICDDVLNRTVVNGFLISGWYRYHDRLFLRGRSSIRQKEVREGVTLVGDEDYTRHRVGASYHLSPWGDLGVEYQRRVRVNDDIDTRADYDAVSLTLKIGKDKYGDLDISYSYYQGEYENRAQDQWRDYGFQDNILAGVVTLAEYHRTRCSFGGTYYRSKRDNDLEKINGHIAVKYLFRNGYAAEARYQVLNYDDFLIRDNYYTGNIVEISLIKEFSF